jgi:hypothetical protein
VIVAVAGKFEVQFQGSCGIPAPEGPWTLAAGEAQRNPWERRISFVSAPEGRLNYASPVRPELCRPSGAGPNWDIFLRVPLRSTRSYSQRPRRGRSATHQPNASTDTANGSRARTVRCLRSERAACVDQSKDEAGGQAVKSWGELIELQPRTSISGPGHHRQSGTPKFAQGITIDRHELAAAEPSAHVLYPSSLPHTADFKQHNITTFYPVHGAPIELFGDHPFGGIAPS